MPRDVFHLGTPRSRDWLHVATQRQLTARQILEAVSEVSGVSMRNLLGDRRSHPIVRPRMLAMWLVQKHTGRSLTQIGRDVGGRDHTTVLHAVRRWPELRDADADLARLEREATALLAQQGYMP